MLSGCVVLSRPVKAVYIRISISNVKGEERRIPSFSFLFKGGSDDLTLLVEVSGQNITFRNFSLLMQLKWE